MSDIRLIDANALKEALNFVYDCAYIDSKSKEGIASDIIATIDNAPTVAVETDEYGREHFNGICPYTNKKCDAWTCGICKVEERERKFAEGDTDKMRLNETKKYGILET